MDGLQQLAQAQVPAAQADATQSRAMDHANVAYDNAHTMPGDFAAVLENYRARSDKVDDAVRRSVGQSTGNGKMLRQLADLYSYAVDTQLLVRAAGQMTSGLRQLVSGQ